MAFFEYGQNNSGGQHVVTDRLCGLVIIEAESASAADDKLLSMGGYFDGVEDGMDCECCGDRWNRAYGAMTFPYQWCDYTFENVEAFTQHMVNKYHDFTTPCARIFFADGRVLEVNND